MCLLERVLEWDATRVRCAAVSHRHPDNPLRAHGRLGAACGIEYAAQAMAVHGALCATGGDAQPVARGMLTSMRGVTMEVDRLDDIAQELIVEARRVADAPNAIAYEFEVTTGDVAAGGRVLLAGRAMITLQR